MRRERIGPRTLMACLGMLFLSCVAPTRTYDGDPLPKSETAVIVGMQPFSLLNPGTTTKVTSVDGWPVKNGTKVELLPGTHTLEIYANHQFGKGSRTVTLEFEAGIEYVIAMSTNPARLVEIVPARKR